MMRIVLKTQVYFLLPVLILLFPKGLMLSWIIAAAIHEIFHILILRIFRIRIISFEIGITGAKIETAPMEPYKELIVALSGPVGPLLFLAFSRHFPQVAICIIAQSIFNLLPVYPLDGGRAVRCAFSGKMTPKNLSALEKYILYVVTFSILFLTACFKLGILPIIFVIGLIVQYRNANIPCKDRKQRVQ